MIDVTPLWGFILVSLVVILAPGSDVFLLIRSAMTGGRRSGFATFAGIHVGNIIVTTLVACGLGAIVARNHLVMHVIQVAGAAYLLWLAQGAARSAWKLNQQRRHPVRDQADVASTAEPTAGDVRSSTCFARGLATNLTNPKTLVFYLSFLPQFLGHARNTVAQLELLAWAFILLAMIWEAAVVLLAARMQHLMRRPVFGLCLDTLCSMVFLALAVAIAVESF